MRQLTARWIGRATGIREADALAGARCALEPGLQGPNCPYSSESIAPDSVSPATARNFTRATQGRLRIARPWELPDNAFAVSGTIADVSTLLDDLEVPRVRDQLTGDVTHPGLVLLFDADGTLAYASTGGTTQLVELAGRL